MGGRGRVDGGMVEVGWMEEYGLEGGEMGTWEVGWMEER